MFEKKKCPNCGEKIKDEWNFCPYCGEEFVKRARTRESSLIPFGEDIFEEIEKEFERMDKMFGLPSFKFSSFKSKPFARGGGISITIRSGTGMEPKIDVKTSGEFKKIEPELKRKLGLKSPVEEVEEEAEEEKVEPRKIPKVTEEPETQVKNLGDRQIISIKLPGVESEEDIEIKKLEQSLEVKAFAGEKAYFTLLPIPKGSSILEKKFKDGVLNIEIKR
ncbi:MAG: zinc ribbon domain-containing protein [Candidatus Aenigmatarchaeota archaeon]